MSRSAPGRPKEPYIPATYIEDVEIPFAPDGNAPLISGFVEKVKGTTPTFKDLRCVRKTIIIDPEADGVLQTSLKHKLVQEVKILWLARHQHVVQLVHTYFEQIDKRPTRFAVIMDRADSSLQIYLELGERPARRWFGCLMSVVQHIHALGIRHRDIKPSNILVKEGKILLADFGISQVGLGNTMPTTYEGRKVSRTKKYYAPEVERGSTHGRSADIFSLGAVFLEILVALNDLKYSAQLHAVLKPSFESTPSYAQNINAIHQWLKDSFQPLGWQEGILSTCQEMLNPVRGARPRARKIVQIWSNRPVSDRYMFCDCTGGPGISFLTEKVVHKFVDALFCTEELSIVHQSAIEDSAIGVARFTRNVRRMISDFGRAIKIEFGAAEPSVFAKALQSRNVSDRAARRIVHMNNREVAAPVHSAHSIDVGLTRQHPMSIEKPESVVSAPERDDSSDASTDSSTDEQLKDDPRIEEMYTARGTLQSSQAYQDFKARLLDFAHNPYEDRIRSIIEEAFATEECLPKDAVRSLSRELSWVPTQLFTFCNNRLGILENLKACVFYKSNIEYWQWWPSQLVRHSTKNGDFRLSWHTPCGNPRSIDLPNRLVLPLQEVFSTAPMFQETCQPMHTIAHTAKPFHTAASSFGSTNMHASNGNVSPSQPPSGPLRQGHDLSTTPLQSQQSAAANAAALSSDTRSNNNRSANQGHIYLCIKSGGSYQFSTLEAHSLMSDVRLFSGIKKEYHLARKGFMHWFSIWRYSHCDFFQFSRFAMGAAPLSVGFPLASDMEYDFQPRPISPQPPFGPISKIEFRERFYTYCEDCCHRWHQQQMKRWLPVFQDVDAIKLMPKRTVALEMQDGKRGLFWGLLVREERRDEIVLLYACLVNLPGIIFFFLWLFDWGHAADLQNASVPFLTSLSLTVGFVGWLFQSSRDDV